MFYFFLVRCELGVGCTEWAGNGEVEDVCAKSHNSGAVKTSIYLRIMRNFKFHLPDVTKTIKTKKHTHTHTLFQFYHNPRKFNV